MRHKINRKQLNVTYILIYARTLAGRVRGNAINLIYH